MKLKKLIIRILVIVLIFAAIIIAFFYRASAPVRKDQKEVTKVAREYADLKTIDDYYIYVGNHTYYTVTGKNDKNQNVLVTIPKSEGKVIIQNQDNGLTEAEARKKVEDEFHPYHITKVEFGYYNNQPIWEITAQNEEKQLNYYTISFKDGRLINKIENF